VKEIAVLKISLEEIKAPTCIGVCSLLCGMSRRRRRREGDERTGRAPGANEIAEQTDGQTGASPRTGGVGATQHSAARRHDCSPPDLGTILARTCNTARISFNSLGIDKKNR